MALCTDDIINTFSNAEEFTLGEKIEIIRSAIDMITPEDGVSVQVHVQYKSKTIKKDNPM